MFMGGSKEERGTRWQACLPEDSAERKSATAALNFLFPMTNGISANSHPRSDLRVSEQSGLIRFLALTSITGVQEVAEIYRMLASPGDVTDLVVQTNQASATEMVNHMTAYIGDQRNGRREASLAGPGCDRNPLAMAHEDKRCVGQVSRRRAVIRKPLGACALDPRTGTPCLY